MTGTIIINGACKALATSLIDRASDLRSVADDLVEKAKQLDVAIWAVSGLPEVERIDKVFCLVVFILSLLPCTHEAKNVKCSRRLTNCLKTCFGLGLHALRCFVAFKFWNGQIVVNSTCKRWQCKHHSHTLIRRPGFRISSRPTTLNTRVGKNC